MSSPSRKSWAAIDVKCQKVIKSEPVEDSGTIGVNGSQYRKIVRKVKLNESDESPVQSQSSNESPGTALVGRSGRVRKAKVVFDPSDMEIGLKRKSWSVAENETKLKKVVRTSDAKKEEPAPQQPTPENVKKIDYRRKTVGSHMVETPAADENGCIVCSRVDIKKGRFVVCIHCPTRGHFTCLRNAKYLGSAPEEKHWQCSECLRCAQCNDKKQTEILFKCTLCFMSFHLKCMADRLGPITKKKFKCDNCLAVDDREEKHEVIEDVVDVQKRGTLTKKSSGNGFAGFSQEDTTKSSSRSRSSSSGCISDVRAESWRTQQAQPEQHRKPSLSRSVPLHRSTSSNKSVSYGAQSPPLFATADIKSNLTNFKVEPEDREVTPEPESSVSSLRLTQSSTHSIDEPKKRKSNFDSDVSELNEMEKCDIRYDRRTRIWPHESIPDVKKWDCDEVYTYFLGTTTAEYAHLFREHQIDGDALLLIKREDVLNRFNLKLGPALRLYSHIVTLQYKNNNPILAWDED